MMSATSRMRSASRTDEPPNLYTTLDYFSAIELGVQDVVCVCMALCSNSSTWSTYCCTA